MGSRSRSKTAKDKAVIFYDGTVSVCRKTEKTSYPERGMIWQLTGPPANLLIVGKAYNEPQGINHIENILLERDFIID